MAVASFARPNPLRTVPYQANIAAIEAYRQTRRSPRRYW